MKGETILSKIQEKDVELNKECIVKGTITHVFHSSFNWASAVCLTDKHKVFKASGKIFDAQEDGEYEFTGTWTVHEKYGLQFTVTSSKISATVTRAGIISFLSSGFISGLGLKKAEKIVNKFGLKTYEIIEKEPLKLTEISGISKNIAIKIQHTYLENTALRSLREYLPPEISDNKVVALYSKYKEKSIEVLERNPYQIIKDVDGIGFLTADKMATNMGIKRDDPRRINAGIIFLLQEAQQEGHCYSYADNLQHNLLQLMGDCPVMLIADEIKKLRDEKEIVVDSDGAIYYAPIYHAEVGVAEILKDMINRQPALIPSMNDIQQAVKTIEKKTGFKIEAKQHQAAELVFNNSFSIITGGPGTGKTTIIQLILEIWKNMMYSNRQKVVDTVALTAPTGKAARRMSEVTEHDAKTIHQTLKYIPPHERDKLNGMFHFTKHNLCPHLLFVVDEASMLDIQMSYALMQAVKKGARIVLIGDIDQLPPIGPGNFFRDMVTSFKVPSVKLELAFRQQGKIAVNAMKIKNGMGVHAFVQDDSFSFRKAKKDEIQDMVVNAFLNIAREYGVINTAILSPMKTRSNTGTEILNTIIQNKLNPHDGVSEIVKHGKKEFRVGDRIIQTKNNWAVDLANGDMGTIEEITKDVVTVFFDSSVVVEYKSGELFSNIMLGYAITIHKSQGSEYKAVVVAHNSEHWFMAQRNLLYTAVTRAKEKVILIGDAKTIARAVENVVPITRNTKLKMRF